MFRYAFNYIRFYFRAFDEHGVHSPFVYDLYTNVIQDDRKYYVFDQIEQIRAELLTDRTFLDVRDLGAGSKKLSSQKRSISQIAKIASTSTKKARLLFRLVSHFAPKTSIELGTSLGISSLYLATPSENNHLITIEGCPQIAEKAKDNFEELELDNIELLVGNIDDLLEPTLNAINKIDFAFLDANHRYAPTVKYFEQLLLKAHNDTVFVFDDIHWSKEMENAWKHVISHPEVSVSVDLYWLGIVFIRKEQAKQHFELRF